MWLNNLNIPINQIYLVFDLNHDDFPNLKQDERNLRYGAGDKAYNIPLTIRTRLISFLRYDQEPYQEMSLVTNTII